MARLAATVGPLVEVHGQHDQSGCSRRRAQRTLLDAFGGHAGCAEAVAAAVRAWRENDAALRRAGARSRGSWTAALELAEHAAKEIEAAAPRAGEVDELRRPAGRRGEHGALARLIELLRSGSAGRGPVRGTCSAGRLATPRSSARLDARLADLAQRMRGPRGRGRGRSRVELAPSPAETEADAGRPSTELEERLGLLYGAAAQVRRDARRRCSRTARRLARRRTGCAAWRASERAQDGRQLAAGGGGSCGSRGAERGSRGGGEQARRERHRSAARAGLPRGCVPGRHRGRRHSTRPAPTRSRSCFAPNPGEPSRPLARIASGGELSRVALAIKSVLAAADTTPTLVFDEVDAGIGGRSADPVGREPVAAGARPPGALRHPPAADRGATPTRTSRSASGPCATAGR